MLRASDMHRLHTSSDFIPQLLHLIRACCGAGFSFFSDSSESLLAGFRFFVLKESKEKNAIAPSAPEPHSSWPPLTCCSQGPQEPHRKACQHPPCGPRGSKRTGTSAGGARWALQLNPFSEAPRCSQERSRSLQSRGLWSWTWGCRDYFIDCFI